MDLELVVLNLLLVSSFLLHFCTAIDTITFNQSIADGQTLISSGENFVLGFFSPENSANRYVGIWYNKVPEQTVVWVANREHPIRDSSGVVRINNDGNLVIVDGRQRSSTIWSSNIPVAAANSSVKLLDTGNLILSQIDQDEGDQLLWQSFDYPTDSLLPYMKFGLNLRSGMNWNLTSWKSKSNPAVGNFSFVLDPRGSPQFFLMKGSNPYSRSGPWNGQGPSAAVDNTVSSIFNYSFIDQEDEIYYTYNLYNSSIISRLFLDDTGLLHRLTWINNNSGWVTYWSAPTDRCDRYAQCGAYGTCGGYDALLCECLRGFEPRSPREWSLRDGSDGCVRRTQLDCRNGDRFYKLEHVKLADTSSSRVDPTLNLEECEKQCLTNCSCTAYASSDIRGGGSGCLNWYGDLVDLKSFTDVGQVMYIRVSASELDVSINRNSTGSDDSERTLAIVTVTVSLGMFLFVSCGYFLWRKKMKGGAEKQSSDQTSVEKEIGESKPGTELSLFDIDTILAATNNFCSANKLGEGGFGPVYKGVTEDGEEIAIKRLSKNSGQGREEFKNEVILIAKLQHRNLVRLRGYCIQVEERMLIYEYMPNKSLDYFIFDRTRRMLLDWRKRFNIILGIARGVLYLHQDSRLKIIHRDLKASNILLDAEMNPKISDFGMARIFGGNQTQANTIRVVGTRGYMSPEYAMDGLFSEKSDVFSFGVLLLEIISGKRNNGYYHSDPLLNLIRHIWNMWREGRGLEILDSSMTDLCISSEVLRCIQVGLLCVQENAAERPTMSSVVFMLSNETTVPPPKQPSFSIKNSISISQPAYSTGSSSINEVTVTAVEGR